jgi:hypothetical protein
MKSNTSGIFGSFWNILVLIPNTNQKIRRLLALRFVPTRYAIITGKYGILLIIVVAEEVLRVKPQVE